VCFLGKPASSCHRTQTWDPALTQLRDERHHSTGKRAPAMVKVTPASRENDSQS